MGAAQGERAAQARLGAAVKLRFGWDNREVTSLHLRKRGL